MGKQETCLPLRNRNLFIKGRQKAVRYESARAPPPQMYTVQDMIARTRAFSLFVP